MSSANVDLVRAIYAVWERGDYRSTEWADPEIEFAMVGGPEPAASTGVTGMAQAWRKRLSAWDEFGAKAEEYREVDHERVLVLVQNTGRGKARGLEIAQMQTLGAALFKIRDRKVTRLVIYWDRTQAFADLGLAPEAHAADSP
jgi:ketosteroid isomerase-like protein